MEDHAAQLEGLLGQANDLREVLGQLLSQLEEMKGGLKSHAPPRVSPTNIEKQLEALAVSVTSMGSSYVSFWLQSVAYMILMCACMCIYR